jgi:hypothetical protein
VRRLPRVSGHAVERYLERVEPAASRQEARAALHRLLCVGRRRSRPRHWMRGERVEPGLTFVYGALSPGVCLLVRDEVVLTVKTRELFRTEPRACYLASSAEGANVSTRTLRVRNESLAARTGGATTERAVPRLAGPGGAVMPPAAVRSLPESRIEGPANLGTRTARSFARTCRSERKLRPLSFSPGRWDATPSDSPF